MHEIEILGNLGGDPEMRYTQSGAPVTNFSVAANRQWTGEDGVVHKETIWFRVSAWRRLAETCNEYLKKGRQVLVKGRLNADSETGGPRVYQRNDGTSGASYEVTARMVRFLGGPGDNGGAASDAVEPEDTELIPF